MILKKKYFAILNNFKPTEDKEILLEVKRTVDPLISHTYQIYLHLRTKGPQIFIEEAN